MFHFYIEPPLTASATLPCHSRVFTPDGYLFMPYQVDKDQKLNYANIPDLSLLCIPHYNQETQNYHFMFYIQLSNKVVVEPEAVGLKVADYVKKIQSNYTLSIGQVLHPHQDWNNWQTVADRYSVEMLSAFTLLMDSGDQERDELQSYRHIDCQSKVAETFQFAGINITDENNHRAPRSKLLSKFDVKFYLADLEQLFAALRGYRGVLLTVTVVNNNAPSTRLCIRLLKDGTYINESGDPVSFDTTPLYDPATVSYVSVALCERELNTKTFYVGRDIKEHTITQITFMPSGADVKSILPVPVYKVTYHDYPDYDNIPSISDKLEGILNEQAAGVDGGMTWREHYNTHGIFVDYQDYGHITTMPPDRIPLRRIHLIVDNIDHTPPARKAWRNSTFVRFPDDIHPAGTRQHTMEDWNKTNEILAKHERNGMD